jgi:hypothetical protein
MFSSGLFMDMHEGHTITFSVVLDVNPAENSAKPAMATPTPAKYKALR